MDSLNVCSCEHLHALQCPRWHSSCLFIAHLNPETAANSQDRDLHLGRHDVDHKSLPHIVLEAVLSPSPALRILNGKPRMGRLLLPSHSMPSSVRLT